MDFKLSEVTHDALVSRVSTVCVALVRVWEKCGVGKGSVFHVPLWKWRKHQAAEQWCLCESHVPCPVGLGL